jgi:hypothetical protein
MTTNTGQLFYDPIARPLSALGVSMPGAYYNFYVSGTTNPAPVFQDAGQTLPFPAASLNGSNPLFTVIQADGTGAMPPMFLNPEIIYRVQLYNSTWSLIEDVDPYVPSMPITGNGQLQIDAQGEVTINSPVPGGTGVTLSVDARTSGTALSLNGSGVGAPAIIANTTVVAGSQTATFVATNKPGSATTAPTKWLPITCDGATYYIPLWQ